MVSGKAPQSYAKPCKASKEVRCTFAGLALFRTVLVKMTSLAGRRSIVVRTDAAGAYCSSRYLRHTGLVNHRKNCIIDTVPIKFTAVVQQHAHGPVSANTPAADLP
jgi:hypothetical protein